MFVGTVDKDGVPGECRAIALRSTNALKTATVYVPLATSQNVIANVASTRRIAVVSSYPLDHVTTQIKGETTSVRLASDEEAELLRDRVEGLAEVLHTIGIPRRVTRNVNYWPAFAIEFAVEEIFEQTPGPRAGVSIR